MARAPVPLTNGQTGGQTSRQPIGRTQQRLEALGRILPIKALRRRAGANGAKLVVLVGVRPVPAAAAVVGRTAAKDFALH